MSATKAQIKPLILLGAGGHARVLLSLVKELGFPLLGVCAPELIKEGQSVWRGLNVLGNGDELKAYNPSETHLINGIGQLVDTTSRRAVFERFKSQGYYFPALIHPKAYVDSFATLDEGVQVMAGAIVQADASIGKNVIINTLASIDHDCTIEEHVHIAPGAILCGNVSVSKGAFIATGACISQGIIVGEGAVVGAGVSIVQDVSPRQLVTPALVRRIDLNTETYVGEK